MSEWKKIVGTMEIRLDGQKRRERPTQIIQIISHLNFLFSHLILNLTRSIKSLLPLYIQMFLGLGMDILVWPLFNLSHSLPTMCMT